MIVLPVSSQVVYTIDNKRFTCYNDFENREIAKLILLGDKAYEEVEITKAINATLFNQNKELKDAVVKANVATQEAMDIANDCLVDNAFLHQRLDISDAKIKNLNTWNYILAGVNAVLLGLIFK